MGTQDAVGNSIYRNFLNPNKYSSSVTADRKLYYTNMYVRKLTSACVSRYKWTGLPEEIDERYLNVSLHFSGLVVFARESQYDKYVIYRATSAGMLDMYDNPLQYQCYANNLLNKTYDANDVEPIWSNAIRVPDHDITLITAQRLAEFDISIDMLAIATRHPVVLVADENTQLSLINIFRNLQAGEPFIGVHKQIGRDIDEFVKAFDLGINSASIADLQIAKTRLMNEYMGFMGINNANQDKRERLVAQEVNANNSQVGIFRSDAMGTRLNACKRINERWGLNVSVEWNESQVSELDSAPINYGPDTSSRVEVI